MAKKARSARGEVVDFDLLSIKQQIAASNENKNKNEQEVQVLNIQRQQNFIDRKIKRKIAKTLTQPENNESLENIN